MKEWNAGINVKQVAMLVRSQVKYIQSLGQKETRDSESLFIAEGPRFIAEILKFNRDSIIEIFALKEWIAGNEESIGNANVVPVDEGELKRISFLQTPNKALAVVRKPQYSPVVTKGNIIVALDSIQDPGNLGSIVRTCDWFGVDTIVCNHGTADVFSPKVVQSTMGSILRVNCVYTSLDKWLEEQDVPVYGTLLDGKPVGEIGQLKEGIILIGNEGRGISDDLKKYITEKITIPGAGRAESLNASVATGIVLAFIMR